GGASARTGRSRVQAVRSISTSVVRPFAKFVRAPVQVYGIEGCYATALYSAASKQNKLDQVKKELLHVGQLLKDPKRSIKVKSLKDISTKEKFSPLTANLMSLLAENGRLSNAQGVISAFSTIMSVHHGVHCTVTMASSLEEAVLSKLKTVLNSFLRQGQVLKLEVKTDPSVMGGMIVRNKCLLLSFKSQFEKLQITMWHSQKCKDVQITSLTD
uniref:Oligomycin sensitivity conferral protein n=1 Tax=Peromyscus maniculatus bairdii TaxID=230844 RepID=A0A8C8U8L5_PERMB